MLNKKWFVALFFASIILGSLAVKPVLARSDAEEPAPSELVASVGHKVARAAPGPVTEGAGVTYTQNIHALLQNPPGPGHMSPETWLRLFSLLPEESPKQQSAAADTRNAE